MPINGPNIIIEDFNIHMLTQSAPNNLHNIAKNLWEVKSSKSTTINNNIQIDHIWTNVPWAQQCHFISTQAYLYKPQTNTLLIGIAKLCARGHHTIQLLVIQALGLVCS
jgi:hypothetical protein